MIPTHKLHHRFGRYWPEYKNNHLLKVCKAIVELMELGGKGDVLHKIKTNWPRVCEWLIEWEGKKVNN